MFNVFFSKVWSTSDLYINHKFIVHLKNDTNKIPNTPCRQTSEIKTGVCLF